MIQPKFIGGLTVLLSVYKNDSPKLFEKAIRSIFQNTLKPDQVIIVIDGPIDLHFSDLINHLQSCYGFKIIKLEMNLGLARALNEGLKYVSTEWIARADADDINSLTRFEKQSLAIQNSCSNIDIIGGAIQEIDTNGEFLQLRRTPSSHEEIVAFLKRRNPFNHMTVIFRTKFVKYCGGYPNIYLREDYALWAKMIANGAKSLNINDILVYVTAGDGLIARRGGVKYAFGEFKLQYFLIMHNVKSIQIAFWDLTIRFCFFILPFDFRKYLYKLFLRDNR